MSYAPESIGKYKFKHFSNLREKALICPKCFGMVMRDDIEFFIKCPFCNSSLEMNSQLEDYILKPVIEQWIYRQGSAFPEIYLDVGSDISRS